MEGKNRKKKAKNKEGTETGRQTERQFTEASYKLILTISKVTFKPSITMISLSFKLVKVSLSSLAHSSSWRFC